jgi:hypothetical protein
VKHDRALELVAALRSGDYTQGVDRLEDLETGAMCCLGVGSALAVKAGVCQRYVIPETDEEDAGAFYGTDGEFAARKPEDCGEVVLAPSVQYWLGMATMDGDFREKGVDSLNGSVSLAVANDAGVPFDEIADFIEEHWEVL